MKLIVRDYVGYYYELECLCDDTVGIIVEHYKRMRRDSVVLDETQYQYVVRGGGVIFERTQVLEDIGLSDESTLRIDIRKMKVEFESIDFEQKLKFKFKNTIIRGDNKLYLNWLSQLANDGWEIVDVYYHCHGHGMSNEFPKILFQRKI